jgi:hypothetical protein
MEQRSLRNVRALLDRLEAEADHERRSRRVIGGIVAVVAVLALAGAYYVAFDKARHGSREIVITPPTAHR